MTQNMAAIGRIGGLTTSSRHDGKAITEAARNAAFARFLHEVDPKGVLDQVERIRRAKAAQSAHMARLALKSATARRRKGASA